MARKLLCPDCNTEISKLAKKYDEHFESIEGNANDNYRCDDCGKLIETNDTCFASVLLPDFQHHMYEFQKPSAWKDDYFILK